MNRCMTINMTRPIKRNQVINDYEFTNIFINGNFVNTTGWIVVNATHSAASNTLTNTGNGGSANPYDVQATGLTVVVGNKLYIKCKRRVTNTVCSGLELYAYAGSSVDINTRNTPTQNIWYTDSGIITEPVGWTGAINVYVQHNYADAATANGKVMEVKEVMAIDLTSTYGKGNEPTIAECNSLFDTWFNGTEFF